jgi:hypothetical protein
LGHDGSNNRDNDAYVLIIVFVFPNSHSSRVWNCHHVCMIYHEANDECNNSAEERVEPWGEIVFANGGLTWFISICFITDGWKNGESLQSILDQRTKGNAVDCVCTY